MMMRIRLIYSKGEDLKFTGNLDMQKVWERSFRRADLPLAYSQGFHPQAKIHQACPLPLGFTSQGELLDFWLESDLPLVEIAERLEKALQPGITIHDMRIVPAEEKPLQTRVVSTEYEIFIDPEHQPDDLPQRIKSLLSQTECIRERRGKNYDLLPLIESLKVDENDGCKLEMRLAAKPSATGRPEEVLDALGIDLKDTSTNRKGVILAE